MMYEIVDEGGREKGKTTNHWAGFVLDSENNLLLWKPRVLRMEIRSRIEIEITKLIV